jgi:hypothetical protein
MSGTAAVRQQMVTQVHADGGGERLAGGAEPVRDLIGAGGRLRGEHLHR